MNNLSLLLVYTFVVRIIGTNNYIRLLSDFEIS